jgi:hypothetical protein
MAAMYRQRAAARGLNISRQMEKCLAAGTAC